MYLRSAHLWVRLVLHVVVLGDLHQVLLHQHLWRCLYTQFMDESLTDGGHLLLTTCLHNDKEKSLNVFGATG